MAGESSDMLEREGKAAARLVPNCVRSMRYAFVIKAFLGAAVG